MKKWFLLFAPLLCGRDLTAGPIPIGSGTLIYSQNFDTLASTPNNNPSATRWADDSTIPGWWHFHAGNVNNGNASGLGGASEAFYVANGAADPATSPLAHGFYSLGALNASDRAMGLCPKTDSGELSAIVIFQNTAATPLKLTHVKYTAKTYRSNTTTGVHDSLFVWWRAAATSASLLTFATAPAITNPSVFVPGSTTTSPNADYITGWTNLPDFTSTHVTSTTGSPLSPPVAKAFDADPASAVIVQPGAFLALRWSNINDAGTDALQGFDDLELTFAASSGCILQGLVTKVTRLPGADADSAADDAVQIRFIIADTAGAVEGWKVPAGGFGAGAAGEYDAITVLTFPIADFGATGVAGLRIEDSSDPDCSTVLNISAPPFIQKVTATNSPTVTFTPAAVGAASYYAPPDNQSELGWAGGIAGGTTNSNVQVQPSEGLFTGTAKYWDLNTPNTIFTTAPVDAGSIAGQDLEGRIELALYTTSDTGLEATDVLGARMEVALDGDFGNEAAGNILTAAFVSEPGTATDVFGSTIPAAANNINLMPGTFPTTDFTFHPFVKTVSIPQSATAARAHIVFSSGAGISNEHVLLDNVRFSLPTPAGDTDGDGMPDAWETANGLNPNSSADRDTDFDGDSVSNYLEFLAGTQANDPHSALRITAADISTSREISLTWTSVAGKRYQAQISADLGNGHAWTTLGAVITATASSTSLPSGIIIPAGNNFIRIAVVP